MLRPRNSLPLAMPTPPRHPLGFTTCILIFIHICVNFQFCNLDKTYYFLVGYFLLYAQPFIIQKCFYLISVSLYTSAIFSSPYMDGRGDFPFLHLSLHPKISRFPNVTYQQECHATFTARIESNRQNTASANIGGVLQYAHFTSRTT